MEDKLWDVAWICRWEVQWLVGESGKADEETSDVELQRGVARKFFAILSSHLRGRCGSLVRAHSKGWYDSLGEFLPSTKQRSLSLAQALSQYPNFSGKQSMMESILQFEQLVQAYETSSSQTYPKDLMDSYTVEVCTNKDKRSSSIISTWG